MTDAMPGADSTQCSGPLHPAVIAGLVYFNQGEYFEAHEALEEAWRDETGPIRDLYRGILQVGVAYYHILRGNYSGADKLFNRCGQYLEPFGDACRGIDLRQFREDYQAAAAHLRQLGPEHIASFRRSYFKAIRYTIPAQGA